MNKSFERGSGEQIHVAQLLAITVATRKSKINDSAYTSVHMKGGKAQVKWSGSVTDSIYLMGKSEYIFEGIYFIK